MARPGAHVGKAELLEQLADIALVIVDAEALGDDALKINPPPAHDAVDFPSGPLSTIFANSSSCSGDRRGFGPRSSCREAHPDQWR